jgi:hypothetical protein
MAMKVMGIMMQEHWIKVRRKIQAIGWVMEADLET